MNDDIVTRQLHRQLEHCRTPSRHRSILRRWSDSQPTLADMTIDTIIDVCRRETIDQNPMVTALIALHQAGDDDATTVLLSVCRPVVYGIAHHAHRSTSTEGNHGADPTSYWAALGHVLATIDPTPPVSEGGRPKVFLAHIGAAVFQCRKQLDASERRRHRYNRRRGDNRVVALTDEIIDEQHERRCAHELHLVEDAALARIELARIADAVRTGAIGAERWRRLVDHRIELRTAPSSTERVAVHRTAAKLSSLVDHAA